MIIVRGSMELLRPKIDCHKRSYENHMVPQCEKKTTVSRTKKSKMASEAELLANLPLAVSVLSTFKGNLKDFYLFNKC